MGFRRWRWRRVFQISLQLSLLGAIVIGLPVFSLYFLYEALNAAEPIAWWATGFLLTAVIFFLSSSIGNGMNDSQARALFLYTPLTRNDYYKAVFFNADRDNGQGIKVAIGTFVLVVPVLSAALCLYRGSDMDFHVLRLCSSLSIIVILYAVLCIYDSLKPGLKWSHIFMPWRSVPVLNYILAFILLFIGLTLRKSEPLAVFDEFSNRPDVQVIAFFLSPGNCYLTGRSDDSFLWVNIVLHSVIAWRIYTVKAFLESDPHGDLLRHDASIEAFGEEYQAEIEVDPISWTVV
jgi:hypothetical protein